MPYQDFRQFLDALRREGELIDIDRPIALNDVGKALKQSYVRQGPAHDVQPEWDRRAARGRSLFHAAQGSDRVRSG